VFIVAGRHYEKGLFQQLQETLARLEEVEKQRKLETAQLRQMIEVQTKQMVQMGKEIQLFREENDRLRSILNNNSGNSSQPPSTDQKGKRTNTDNGREKSGRHKGAQAGHPEKTLTRAQVL
jgi:transposase